MMVFDLDPGPPATIVQCAEVACWLKEIFDASRLQVFAKTSGSKGLQLYVPLNTPVTYEQTKPFAQALAHASLGEPAEQVHELHRRQIAGQAHAGGLSQSGGRRRRTTVPC